MSEILKGLLGPLHLRPALLEATDLRDSDFPAGRYRQAFSAIAELWEESRPAEIDPVILAERIGGNGASAFVGSLLDGSIKLEPEAFRLRVAELRKRTISARIRSKLHAQEKLPELDLGEILPDIEELEKLREGEIRPADFIRTGAELQALEIHQEETVEKAVVAQTIGLLCGPGGSGKTFFTLGLSRAVSLGEPFLGLRTIRRPVLYVDYENPLPMLVERVRKLGIEKVKFWHLSAKLRPPKLDGPDWTLYKKVPEERSLIIFDTLRASYEGKENDSDAAALVMGRLKEVRELGHDIIALHHTTKADDRRYKGSTAWIDLADYTLAFHRVRRGSYEEIEDEVGGQDGLLSFGTGEKTRFAPFRIFLNFDPELGIFTIAEDPKASALNRIAEYIEGEGLGKNQSELVSWAKEELRIKKRDAVRALLERGEKTGRWKSVRAFRGARCYEPI